MRSLLAGNGLSLRRTPSAPVVQNLVRSGRTFANFFQTTSFSTEVAKRYARDSTLYPIVSALAQDTGAVDFGLFRPGESGKDEDRVEVLPGQHPAVDLFDNPNPFYSRSEFVEAGQQWIDLVGECIILVEFIAKMPVRLWVMDPAKFTPIKGDIIGVPLAQKFLLGWVYTADDGTQIKLNVKEVLQIKLPNPDDPWRGIGPVQAALVDIDSSRYSAEWNRMFFINGASPDGVVQIEDSFSDDEFREFTDRWRESHQGIGNAHRVAVLENNAQWVPNAFTHRDMMFAELRSQSSDFIRKAFRFPKTMLGDTDTANRAVAEAGEYQYGKWLITARANRWCSMLNNRLMPLFGEEPAGAPRKPSTRNALPPKPAPKPAPGENPERKVAAPTGKPYWDFEPVVESDDQVEADTVAARTTAFVALVGSGVDPEDAAAVAGLPPMRWERPQQPGFDEDGKPFPKPGEESSGSKDGGKPPGKPGGNGANGSKPGKSSGGTN